MANAPRRPDAGPSPDRISFAARMRFNPQLLVFVATVLAASPAIVGLVVSGIHVLWGGSFRQVDFTMQRAEANDGTPYIGGTLAGTEAEHLVSARLVAGRFLVGTDGDESYAPGKTIKVWWSKDAPDLLINGQRTNGVPVAALPERPGIVAFAGYLAWLVAAFAIGARVARWVARRTARWQDVTITN
jgi:hypothetical protein